MRAGDRVEHEQFGSGDVKRLLGSHAEVSFFGEVLTVPITELRSKAPDGPAEIAVNQGLDKTLFRRAFEAVNLGIVPPHPDQLLALSVGGAELAARVQGWLEAAPTAGLCKLVLGDYGRGKSHHLRVVEALALKAGWAVAFVEFDPKQADPAKPHLVYGAIMGALRLPARQGGREVRGVHELVGEVRRHWHLVSDAPQLRANPWFDAAFEILRKHPHNQDREYVEAVDWLFGQIQRQPAIHNLARSVGLRSPRAMPRSLECSEIYVHHLVVVNELCHRLGYEGLLVVLDEAEHVRGFSVNRRERATSLFDALAQAAHAPVRKLPRPAANAHGVQLPQYWKQGPHFGLVVALTEGGMFHGHTGDVRDACVFAHDQEDLIRLTPPAVEEYKCWCVGFLEEFRRHYPGDALALGTNGGLEHVAASLAAEYERGGGDLHPLRLWTKLAGFVPALLFARAASTPDDIVAKVQSVAKAATGQVMPWEA